MQKFGFKKGHVFCIFSPNCPEFAVAFHGVASLGGIVTTCNPAYKARELNHQLKDSKAKYLLTVAKFADTAIEASKNTDVTQIFVVGGDDGGKVDASKGQHPYQALVDNDGAAFPDHVKILPDDVVALPYSSGTTGLPKGVMLTHRNLVANLAQIDHKELVNLTPKDTLVGLLPFFHVRLNLFSCFI